MIRKTHRITTFEQLRSLIKPPHKHTQPSTFECEEPRSRRPAIFHVLKERACAFLDRLDFDSELARQAEELDLVTFYSNGRALQRSCDRWGR